MPRLARNRDYYERVEKIPPGFTTLVEDMVRTAMIGEPVDIYSFFAEFLERRLEKRERALLDSCDDEGISSFGSMQNETPSPVQKVSRAPSEDVVQKVSQTALQSASQEVTAVDSALEEEVIKSELPSPQEEDEAGAASQQGPSEGDSLVVVGQGIPEVCLQRVASPRIPSDETLKDENEEENISGEATPVQKDSGEALEQEAEGDFPRTPNTTPVDEAQIVKPEETLKLDGTQDVEHIEESEGGKEEVLEKAEEEELEKTQIAELEEKQPAEMEAEPEAEMVAKQQSGEAETEPAEIPLEEKPQATEELVTVAPAEEKELVEEVAGDDETTGLVEEQAPTAEEPTDITSAAAEEAPTSAVEPSEPLPAKEDTGKDTSPAVEEDATVEETPEKMQEEADEKTPTTEATAPLNEAAQEHAQTEAAEEQVLHTTETAEEQAPPATDASEEQASSVAAKEEVPPTTEAAEEQAPIEAAKEEVPPTTEAQEERVPTEAAKEEVPLTTEAAEDEAPSEVVKEEVPLSTEAAEEQAPSEAAEEEVPPTAEAAEVQAPTEAAKEEVPATTEAAEEQAPSEAAKEEVPPTAEASEEQAPVK
ncbi:fibrous sheath CABYR-binding protein [Lingula anatina]|uniref:Fibrous sheath CABYR-binding protein n=1 Tax=Lingula anatina TaxID=7574 RepID=A0A1S3I158_LINAN|nr:fibrous sheath CABYR-binding protein [Lingula anatina]|eukprot:XP_013391997.1 fibrous sheath CABYR-binding protein [Lingula anatina]